MLTSFFIGSFLLLVLHPELTSQLPTNVNYCHLACGFGHVMCKYSGEAEGKVCLGVIKNFALRKNDQALIIKEHNIQRNRIAAGLVPPFPLLANMLKLEWDHELAHFAQIWANQCLHGHDECRDSQRFQVGQNVAYYWSDQPIILSKTLSERVKIWFEESKEFSPFSGRNASVYSPDESVHTNANIRYIGCGAILQWIAELWQITLVCNYGPLEYEVYEIGAPCSKCPNSMGCTAEYPFLCQARDQRSQGVQNINLSKFNFFLTKPDATFVDY